MATQNTVGSPSPFLDLPPEIRKEILRLLLICKPFIARHFWGQGLHPCVFRVNQQLYSEGVNVLYGENTFRMKIWDKKGYGDGQAEFQNCIFFPEDVSSRLPQYKRIKHHDIFVQLQREPEDGEEEYWTVKPVVRKVATKLSKVPALQHLRITFGVHEQSRDPGPSGCDQVLQSFALLRKVAIVEINGAMPRYAQYLKNVMEGISRLDHLPKMYPALQHLAGSFDEYEGDIRQACTAMEEDEVERFKIIGAKLVSKVVERMEGAFNGLFDHDAEPDRKHEWVIEQRRRSKSSRQSQTKWPIERV